MEISSILYCIEIRIETDVTATIDCLFTYLFIDQNDSSTLSWKEIQSRSRIKSVLVQSFVHKQHSRISLFILLELFLSEKEVSEIHDFEEEQVEEYFAVKDREKKNTTADQIALTSERYKNIIFVIFPHVVFFVV